MRILVLNTDYYQFQSSFAESHPQLRHANYAQLLRSRYDTLFGKADFYPRGFTELGHISEGILANNVWLQNAWARDHGMAIELPDDFSGLAQNNGFMVRAKRRLKPLKPLLHPIASRIGLTGRLRGGARDILLAQIESFRPDVILNQDMDNIDPGLLRAVRRKGRIIIGQCGTDPPPGIDLSVYDFAISLVPWVVEYFRAHGLPASHRHLGFGTSVLEQLGPAPDKDVDVSFVGNIASHHGQRTKFLEALSERYQVALWMPSPENIPINSPLRKAYRGTAWGRDMYNVIRRSRVTLNFHADFSRGSAGNMRLFEATGVGTCLMTDNLSDLHTMFTPNEELLVYDDMETCITRVGEALANDDYRHTVAVAGQQRTLSTHTYRHRAAELIDLIAEPPTLH